MKKYDRYDKHSCEFINESECEEELEEEGINIEDAEKEHFEEYEEYWE